MSLYKNIVRHVATYSIGIIVGKLASILLLPIYTHFLTPADYAVLELLEVTSSVINTLTALHLSDAFFFFYSKESEERGQRSVLMTAFTGAIAAGTAVGIAGYFASGQISVLVLGSPVYKIGFQIVALYALLGFVQELGFAYLRARNRSTTFLVLQIGRLFLQIGITVTLLNIYKGGYLCVTVGSAITSGVMALGFFAEALWRHRGPVRLPLLKSMFRYAFPLGLSGGAMLFLHFGDRFFLERAVPLSQLGLYSLAYKISMCVGYAQLAFVTYWKAQMFSVFREEAGSQVYVRLFTYYMLLLTAVGVCIAAASAPALVILTTQAFHPAVVFIPLLTAAYVIRGAGDYLRTPLLVENRPGLNARVMIWTAVICLSLYALLIPRFRLWGACAATLGAFVCMTGLSYREAQHLRRFSFEAGRLAKLTLAGGISLALMGLVRSSNIAAEIGIGLVSMLLFAVVLLMMNFFDQEERAAASRVWTYARTKLGNARAASVAP